MGLGVVIYFLLVSDKQKHADELVIANQELAFQNSEKQKRADELVIANQELAFQNSEKQKRADELVIANQELAFQNSEKQKRTDELVIAKQELAFQNSEKQKRTDELVIANQELAFQNSEKQKRAVVNNETSVQPAQANRYHDNGDGTVTFKANGLMWQRCSVGQTWTGETCSGHAMKMAWDDAMKLTSNFAGHNDWRVPTNEELRSLIYCSDNKIKTLGKEESGIICTGLPNSPTINTTYFPNTPGDDWFWSLSPIINKTNTTYFTNTPGDYWSSSPGAYGSSYAWGVYFDGGFSSGGSKDYYGFVRLVR
jgi:hypothetical protein